MINLRKIYNFFIFKIIFIYLKTRGIKISFQSKFHSFPKLKINGLPEQHRDWFYRVLGTIDLRNRKWKDNFRR